MQSINRALTHFTRFGSRFGALLILFSGLAANASVAPEGSVYLLPMNCAELLPDSSPFLDFFDAVGRGQAQSNRAFSESVYRILAMRDLLSRKDEKSRLHNPIDILVRKTLCFYREQKAPTGTISFDDANLIAYLKSSMKELEKSVDKAVVNAEFERKERERFEKKLLENQKYVEGVRRRANLEANRRYQKLRDEAARKLRAQQR
jgi:hypothetical protein